jgi:hypothetical protein
MGDKIPQPAEEVIASVQRALKNPKRRAVRSVVFNARGPASTLALVPSP